MASGPRPRRGPPDDATSETLQHLQEPEVSMSAIYRGAASYKLANFDVKPGPGGLRTARWASACHCQRRVWNLGNVGTGPSRDRGRGVQLSLS